MLRFLIGGEVLVSDKGDPDARQPTTEPIVETGSAAGLIAGERDSHAINSHAQQPT
ncbi:MAG: hypothetical protein ABI633_02360 [Burkholderiales bacterium]